MYRAQIVIQNILSFEHGAFVYKVEFAPVQPREYYKQIYILSSQFLPLENW